MITGVRLTQLANGEPLLSSSWNYKNLSGVEAVEKRLEDLFYIAKHLGFNLIIDTIKPQSIIINEGQENEVEILHLNNNGQNGDIWPFDRRIKLYEIYKNQANIELLMEVEFPNRLTSKNLEVYANYFIDLVNQYPWINNWQVMVNPEEKDDLGQYKCDPVYYVKFLKMVYPKLKLEHVGIKIGGPGIYQALVDFNNDIPNNWLSEAIGQKFGTDPKYHEIGNNGFLPYIDFFSIQGRQDKADLKYEIFPSVMEKLSLSISGLIDKDIPIYSIMQGRPAAADDYNALKSQGYYDLREILNCIRLNIIPFKNQLVDEFYDPSDINVDTSKLHYGLLYYYLGNEGQKPAYNEYYFLLKNLDKFYIPTESNKVFDVNPNLDSLTLLNKEGDMSATIIWPKTWSNETVTLTPHYARQYLISNGQKLSITDTTQIVLDNNKFVIVYEKINKVALDIEKLEKKIERKLNYTEETLANLINLLPSTYNKEVRDVNYYKLLRSLALEMSDAKIIVEEIKDNMYIDTVQPDSIYNNFGVLINLKKQPEWDDEKYRRLIKGVTRSLLEGPTPQSIMNAIQLFTNFKVNIYELYKAGESLSSSVLEGVNPQFAFIVEIEKPLDVTADQESIYRDTNYVINIVKPAHTIHLSIITLVGKENYRESYKEKYGIDFSQSDESIREMQNNMTEGIFGWKHLDYPGVLKTAGSPVITNNSLTNSGLFIGPRYVLYDNLHSYANLGGSDEYGEVTDLIHSCLEKFVVDEYKEVEEELKTEFEQIASEHKFGLDHRNLIRLEGNPEDKLRIPRIGGLTTLNNYKLAFASKLSDDVFSHSENFYQDKYVFRNTLKSLRFNKQDPTTVGFHGFNSKFTTNPDKATQFDFSVKESSFKIKTIRLANGSMQEIQRILDVNDYSVEGFHDETGEIKDSSFKEADSTYHELDIFPQNNQYNTWLQLNIQGLNGANGKKFFGKKYEDLSVYLENFESFNLPEDMPDSEVEYLLLDDVGEYLEAIQSHLIKNCFEKYEADIEGYYENSTEIFEEYISPTERIDTSIQISTSEILRERTLGPIEYHTHKKLVTIMNSTENKVFLPLRDLYLMESSEEESLTRVYVNGVLMPSWGYEEIPSIYDPERACGIKFYDDIIYSGDVVNVLYVKDRSVIIGEFPIITNDHEDIYFGVKEEVWKVVNEIDEGLIINYEHEDIFKDVHDYLDTIIAFSNHYENYDKATDVPEFEGNPYPQEVKWNLTQRVFNRLKLNVTLLNNGVLTGFLQERNEIEMIPFENIPKVDDNLQPLIASHTLNETMTSIKPDYEFASHFSEIDIKAKIDASDDFDINGIVFDHYVPKDDEAKIINATVTNKDKYNFKIDLVHNELTMKAFLDTYLPKYDGYIPDYEYSDMFNSPIDEFKYQVVLINIEDYNCKNDDYSQIIIIPHNDEILLENINENTSFGYDLKDEIKGATDSDWNELKIPYSDTMTKEIIDSNDGVERESNDLHHLQSNVDIAFKFGYKFNSFKFLDVPVVEKTVYVAEIAENIEEPLEGLTFGHYMDDEFVPKKDEPSHTYEKTHNDHYNRITTDHLEPKKVEAYNYETYRVKQINLQLELFRIKPEGTEIIKKLDSLVI